jgi:hypothetical protein
MAQNLILINSGLYIQEHFCNSICYNVVFLSLHFLLHNAIKAVWRCFRSTHTCGTSKSYHFNLHHCSDISLIFESHGSRRQKSFSFILNSGNHCIILIQICVLA